MQTTAPPLHFWADDLSGPNPIKLFHAGDIFTENPVHRNHGGLQKLGRFQKILLAIFEISKFFTIEQVVQERTVGTRSYKTFLA